VQKTLLKVIHRKKKCLCKNWIERHWNIWNVFIDLECRYAGSFISISEMKFYWDPKEQSTKQHPVNIRFPKTLMHHT